MKNLTDINNLEELINWLEKFDIPYQAWGQDLTKTVTNLFDEIKSGDCKLLLNSPIRIVHVVQVLIFQYDKVLVEKEQVFSDNRIRARLVPPSEKMKANENWREAAFRCLEEELQLPSQEVNIISTEIKPKIRNRISFSYPGLKSRYHINQVVVSTIKLPPNDFWTYEKNDTVYHHLVNQHKWGWVNPNVIHFNPEESSFDSK
jgi:hypothetical protein